MRAYLLAAAHTLHSELKVARRLLKDPRTPWLAQILLGLAVTYGLLPFDLIPDGIPILASKLTPQAVLDEARHTVKAPDT